MSDNEAFLQEVEEALSEVVKPYQKQVRQEQQTVDLIKKCVQCAGKNDFLQLDELLRNKALANIEDHSELADCAGALNQLREYAEEQVDLYRTEFIDDVIECAEAVELPLEIDFPRFKVLEGIEGEVDFGARQVTINQKKVKSIDPQKMVNEALKIKRQLYDRPFDPQKFIDALFDVYQKTVKAENKSLGHAVPAQQLYRDYVLSLQSKSFFQNMDKGKFKGYSIEQFSVDIWCYMQAELKGAKGKYALLLRSGRNNALWLIDSDGERRQITTISFLENK